MLEVIGAVVAAAVAVGLFYFLYVSFKIAEESKRLREEMQNEAPYKIEPRDTLETTDFSPHVVAVSEQFDKEFPATKRKYTKRNKAYWRKTGKIGKAKKAKKGKARLK